MGAEGLCVALWLPVTRQDHMCTKQFEVRVLEVQGRAKSRGAAKRGHGLCGCIMHFKTLQRQSELCCQALLVAASFALAHHIESQLGRSILSVSRLVSRCRQALGPNSAALARMSLFSLPHSSSTTCLPSFCWAISSLLPCARSGCCPGLVLT